MQLLWYAIIVGMLTVYVVLDGFDFGAGIVHLFVARTDEERRQVFSAIGPFWDGNEVWLIAAGGLMVFAFPRVYAAGFSGFYLPLMIVLWLLIGRGLSIEFRSKEQNLLWRSFWDACFFGSSLVMAVVLGAALGNVIRGVPLLSSGYFNGPLFTNFIPGRYPGVLDWYTITIGVFAALTLAGHGALFLAYRTDGSVRQRCIFAARVIWPVIVIAGVIVTYLTWLIRPQIYESLTARPWTWSAALLIAAGVVLVLASLSGGKGANSIRSNSSVNLTEGTSNKEAIAFGGSCTVIIGLLSATAAGMYPNMLISTIDPAFTLTVANSALGSHGLRIGLAWWLPALLLVVLYFVNLFRVFSGKVSTVDDLYGH